MGFNGMPNNARGRDPDFGAIFMSNSGTKRECFKRKLFGLPSSGIKFVEKVKAGMILFLFEHDKRRLHGVFKASSDGAFNIVPNAFTASGKQFPAQVKFTPIWFCEPLPEKIFRHAIEENYFSTYKFNFGLSEKQVTELLRLFSMRKLEVEAPRRLLTRTEDLKSDWDTVGKVRRSAGREMHVVSVQNEQSMGDNISLISMHKHHRDSLQHNGEDGYIGLNRSDIVVNKQGRASELKMDTTNGYASEYLALKDESRFTAYESEDYIGIRTSEFAVDTKGYVSDYLALKDESRFTVHENKDYMDINSRPNIMGGYSKSPSDEFRGHGDLRLSIRDRLMHQDIRETDQRMVPSDDIPGLHNYDVNPSVFYREPSPTSATQRDISRSNLLYNADFSGLNFNQSPSVGFSSGSKLIVETTSPSRNCERNSLNCQPHLMRTELKDINRWHDSGGGFLNSVSYDSNRDGMLFNEARNSEPLSSESLLHEACNSIPSLRPSSASISPSDIGNSGRVYEPFSSMFYDSKSCLGNNITPVALQENMSHEITLLKNNEMFSPDVSWATVGPSQVQYGDSLNHEYDIGSHGDSQTNNSGHPKKKSSVFSRLSFVQDVKKQESGNNAWKKERGFHTSVDEVMEMVRHSQKQWVTKRMPKPSKHIKAESLSSRTQLIGSRMKDDCFENTLEERDCFENGNNAWKKECDFHAKVDEVMEMVRHSQNQCMTKRMPKPRKHKAESLSSRTQLIGSSMEDDCFENTLEDLSTDLTAASGDNSNKIAEEISFVDFKRRSKVRKLSDETEIRSSNESEKSENLALVQPKRRKLIRPNFNKGTTSDDKGIDVGASLSHESCNLKDANKSTTSHDKGINLGASQNLPMSNGSCNLKDASKSTTSDDKSINLGASQNLPLSHGSCNIEDANKNTTSDDKGIINLGASENLPLSHGSCNLKDASKSTTSHVKSINIGASQSIPLSHGSCNLKDASKSGCALPLTEEKIKTSILALLARAEVQNVAGHTHSQDKNNSHARGHVYSERGEKASDRALTAFNDGSECVENVSNKNVETCAGRGMKAEEEIPKDCGSFVSVEVKDGSEYLQNSGNEKAPIETRHITEGLLRVMDSTKSVSPGTESLHSVRQEQHFDKIVCTGRGINNDNKHAGVGVNTEEGMPKDGSFSFTTEINDGSDTSQFSGNDNAPIEQKRKKL